MRTRAALLVSLGLILSACSVADAGAESTTSEPTSTSVPTTTTTTPATTTSTTEPPGDRSLINGLPVDDPTLLERRVLAVKIDNHPRANPQSGLDQADMVIELMVEGITRFLSVWHESDSEYLGPMRSGRPTDPTLLNAFNTPTFALSGAQGWVQNVIRSYEIPMIKELSPGTFRISARGAPHNLYVNTIELRQTADDRGYPDEGPNKPIWEFGPLPDYTDPADTVTIDFSGNTVVWNWDEETELWYRSGFGEPSTVRDEDGTERPLGFPVLVALYVEQYTASGESGSPVPASVTTGSGKALIFHDGRAFEGTWERESDSEWFHLVDPNGETMLVPPGKVWVSLVPANRGLTYE